MTDMHGDETEIDKLIIKLMDRLLEIQKTLIDPRDKTSMCDCMLELNAIKDEATWRQVCEDEAGYGEDL